MEATGAAAHRRLGALARHLRPDAAAGDAAPRFRLGLIGLGAIGGDLLQLCDEDPELARVDVAAVLVQRPRTAAETAGLNTTVTADPEEFFAAGPFDAVLEVAGHDSVASYGERVLESGAELLVTSVGAFNDDALLTALIAAAERGGTRLNVPSSGIGALDILSAAAVGGLDSVQMTVRKDPSAWYGTVAEELFELDAVTTEPLVLFEGSAREGAKLYPCGAPPSPLCHPTLPLPFAAADR